MMENLISPHIVSFDLTNYDFYLPHMECERSIGLVSRSRHMIFFVDFKFLGLFMNKFLHLSDQKNPSVRQKAENLVPNLANLMLKGFKKFH
jgi:hypothetical protein